jgi:hypothetical protein
MQAKNDGHGFAPVALKRLNWEGAGGQKRRSGWITPVRRAFRQLLIFALDFGPKRHGPLARVNLSSRLFFETSECASARKEKGRRFVAASPSPTKKSVFIYF